MTNKNIGFLILIGLILANLWFWQSTFLGLILGAIYLFFFGKKIGDWLLAGQPKSFKVFYGVLFLLVLISLSGAIIYYFYKLNNFAISLVLILIPLALSKASKKDDQEKTLTINEKEEKPLSLPYLVLCLAYIVVMLSLFSFLTEFCMR